ncbi:MAG TPA: DNA-binding transcriptional regulator [Phycisphaerae bacterium]|nr:DNA-binding transcriptional regulator [Phycisphaerae bacterium]
MRRIVLLIETSRGYGRGILRGVVKYSRCHEPWSFYVTPGDIKQSLPDMSTIDGIIARVDSPRVAGAILEYDIPAIVHDPPENFVISPKKRKRITDMHPDPTTIAKMAAEHFLSKGLHSFAFCGTTKDIWSKQRRDAFVGFLDKHGIECDVFPSCGGVSWKREQSLLAEWLTRLPKPCGIFAATDVRARAVLDAALLANIRVPDEIAVMGVDNDELFCELCQPPLSSVELNGEWAGYESARLLDRMIAGEDGGKTAVFVEPTGIVERQSTDVIAVDDVDVARAVRFIHSNVGRLIGVQNVADYVAASRRSLEIRFKKFLNRTVNAEIQLTRIGRAKEMLLKTDMTVSRIAELAGFGSDTYMGAVFKKRFGMTPLKFRQKNKIF